MDANGFEFHFHDFRSEGLEESKLRQWIERVGWETLLNRRSTSWKQLTQTQRDNIDEFSALTLMLQNPTLIKRPVLELDNGTVHVGFKADEYAKIF